MVIELVEMTISTKYSGFDKLNHRFSYFLVSPFFWASDLITGEYNLA